jgi:hypothetical protein
VKTCIPLNPVDRYSNPSFVAFVINTVFALPTALKPVPPMVTGAIPDTTVPERLTEPVANLPEVTARSAMSPVGIVRLAILELDKLLSTIADPVKFFNV